ncbi:sigma-70 family RNA polymerase sigma factor [Enterococcus phoeniculicola]|uniref:Sigma-70 family RNA polymerase sigma factor n=1 Tax=Enterococcus phoeniculicola ATCC BAA-412 TaxID=1158610 RepID=R3TNC8_9ENTE|nr:sigma-70 family RNA polymerase sigma factor [Enterococcus phoeniculicola]EOL42543.1 sigma-70 family RNA polymerase sigma factor [Enterococcus phoeniculicola ATCC BAA-412]EOT79178.1 hypothetical protein I589_00686 [Enterococcus phoeniculicola ATCC BAA-412]OJG70997.1 sigma-70 family RNA polymerase sigma factor [Enterococcus phoeniculicola]
MANTEFLVKQAQKGNHEAFIQLITAYEKILFNTANKFLKNQQDVADVMQETILISYRDIHTLKNPNYFHTWIYRILVNNCKKILEKNKRVSYEEFDIPTNDSTDKLELAELISYLSDKYRIPLILYYYNDFSINEISQILELPTGTIKSRLHRGRHLLENKYLNS